MRPPSFCLVVEPFFCSNSESRSCIVILLQKVRFWFVIKQKKHPLSPYYRRYRVTLLLCVCKYTLTAFLLTQNLKMVWKLVLIGAP
jgi:hypothetical protein